MSHVVAPCLRNGFPFAIPKFAEDGLPFTEWDGSTYFVGDTSSDAVKQYWPSKVSDKLVRVYGEGSNYCLKFTLDQLAEFYWRAKRITLHIEDLPAITGYSGHAEANGGYFTGSGSEDDPYKWHDTSASVSTPSAPDFSLSLIQTTTAPAGESQPSEGSYMRKDKDAAGNEQKEKDWVQNISSSSNCPLFAANDALLDLQYAVFNGESQVANHVEDIDDGSAASISVGYGFFFGADGGNGTSQPLIPNAENVIQAGPDEFWFAPYYAKPNPDAEFYNFDLLSQDLDVDSVSQASKQGSPEPSIDGEYQQITKSWHVSAIMGQVISPYSFDSVGAHFPFKVRLRSGEIAGTRFGVVTNYLDDTQAGANVSASLPAPYTPPTLILEVEKWWEYDGRYNENTGGPS